MFDHLGEKLVRAAKEVLLYGIVLSWLGGILVCFADGSLIGILILMFGSIGAVLLAVTLSWMGQVLCNQEEMIRRQKELVWILRGKTELPGEESGKQKNQWCGFSSRSIGFLCVSVMLSPSCRTGRPACLVRRLHRQSGSWP